MYHKKILPILFSILVFAWAIVPSDVRASSFTDVSSGNRNYTAIEYLAKLGVVQGYPDKTYRPNQGVSRAEFLKLAIETALKNHQIEQLLADDMTPTGFIDVDETAWYAKYIRYAQKQDWIKGYRTREGKIFRPEQKINKVEGLKILASIQKWPIDENKISRTTPTFLDTPFSTWYAPLVAYARQKNFTEENGDYFSPSRIFLRGKVSEVLFRTMLSAKNGNQVFSEEFTKTAGLELENSNTPVSSVTNISSGITPSVSSSEKTSLFEALPYQDYPENFFDNIRLDQKFPNTFYRNEVYFFEGTIQRGSYKEAFVFIKDDVTGKFENSVVKIIGNTFSIPFHFEKTGNYKLGIILGDAGESKAAPIVVLPALPATEISGPQPSTPSASVEFKNDTTTFTWNNQTNTITKLFIMQGSEQKTFFFRQSKTSYSVPYKEFANFKDGIPVTFQTESAFSHHVQPLKIESDWIVGVAKQFTPIRHQFRETHDDLISFTGLPEKLATPGIVTFSGKAKSDLFQEAAIQKPDGNVESVSLVTPQPTSHYYGEMLIPAGNDYTFQYDFKEKGTYILEINNKNGSAVLNIPVYIEEGIPLIPDFFDLQNFEKTQNSTAPPDQTSMRNQLLGLINAERIKTGLNKVITVIELDTLAVNYANDMSQRDFFSHINPEGLGPNERKIQEKISTDVGENLARSPDLLFAHYGFLRSPIHRKNILNPKWERVGLGFSRTKSGDLLVVEEFSTFPLTTVQLDAIAENSVTQLNQKRQNMGIPPLIMDTPLRSAAETWSSFMAEQNFFDFRAPDGTIFANMLQNEAGNRQAQAIILQSGSQEKILSQLFLASESLDQNFAHIGLALRYDDEGTFKLTAIYAK